MMAMQKRGREARPPFVPSEEWIDAFEAQINEPDFIESSRRFALRRAGLVALAGRKVDDYYASELVQDVLDDTLEGVIAWDPGRVSLKRHVLDAIQSRSRHDYLQARRFKHESLEGIGIVHVERALADQQEHESARAELSRLASEVLLAVRALAADDPEILLLLDAYESDAIKRVDVLRVTSLTSLQYDAARKRMRRLLDQLPHHLRNYGPQRTR